MATKKTTKKTATNAQSGKETKTAQTTLVKIKKTRTRSTAPKVSTSSPPKKPRLIDDRLAGGGEDEFPVVSGFIAFIFLLAVVAVFGYLFLSKDNAGNVVDDPINFEEIVVPISDVPAEGGSEAEESGGASGEAEVELQQLEITNTPTGFLNVRLGPGTSFEKIAEVNPGEVYNVLQYNQEVGWYEIQLDEDRTGWVVRTYVNLQ